MSLLLNLLVICAVIVLVPLAAAVLLLSVSLIWTAISDVKARGRLHRGLDDLLRDRP